MNIGDYRKVAHRGLFLNENKIPENSIPAFEEALKNKLAIEFDVHLTKDNKLVVIHDSDLDRMTGIAKKVEECNLNYLLGLSLLDTDFKIPSLDEVLNIINGQVPLIVEIKNVGKVSKLNNLVYERLKKYNGKYIIESFNPLTILWFRIHAPEVCRGQLAFLDFKKTNSKFIKYLYKKMVFNIITKPNFISYKIEDLTKELSQKIRKKIPLLTWTIDTQEKLKKAIELSDGYIFDTIRPK